MRYHLMLFICVSLCDGFFSISDVEKNEISSCEENPCENGGSCIVLIEGEKRVISCKCTAGYSGQKCEIDKCSLLQCEENEVCVEENGYFECKIGDPCTSSPCENGGSCIAKSDLKEGFTCICADGSIREKCETELCSIFQCPEKEICVLENGEPACKITEEDPCKSNPCANGGSCIANSDFQEGFQCNCTIRYNGETCKTDKCSILQCHENEECVIENGDVKCKIGDLCAEHECKNGGTCLVEEEYAKCICTESFRGDNCELNKSDDTPEEPATTISVKVTSTITITTHKEIDNKTTTSGNTVTTTTVTEPSNTDKLLSSSSIPTRSTSAFTRATTKITKSTKNEVATTTRVSLDDHSSTSIEITSETNTDDHHKLFTVTLSSPSVGNMTSSDNNRVQTSHTLTDGLTTVEYTTNTKNFFKSSSQSSPTISSLGSTSMSTSVSTSADNSGYVSERPQVTISKSTESKEKTETMYFKSTGTHASTTEALNNTSTNNHESGNDINRTNESSKSITIYASLGAVCFAVLVAFAVGGWYLRRRYRRRKRQCYTECDTSSEISRNSDSSYSSP